MITIVTKKEMRKDIKRAKEIAKIKNPYKFSREWQSFTKELIGKNKKDCIL